MICGQTVCETLGVCDDQQARRIGHIAFIGKAAAPPTSATSVLSGHKLSSLNAYGLGRYNPTIHAAAALVKDVSLPLMATIAYAQAAQNHLAAGLASDYDQASRALTQAVAQSVQAVNHLRRLRAVLTQGQTYFEPVDLQALLRTAIEDIRPLCQTLGISLDVRLGQGPCMANLQASQIYEVLKQLLGHCIERAKASDPRKVSAALTPRPDAQWQVTLSTEGGFNMASPQDLDLDQTNLAIASARTIILAHDGKLTIEPSISIQNAFTYKVLIPYLAED